ncbi:toxic anion resistance protein [Marinimicrococcus flavescens]|uniref:Toxic anion resistance protein n=1 Tax=Marinimicrococcus flavescens TaxID=3031815 RepID=A0AAP3XR89_9PROT|nr:toxic anion resistance protein [Marinimicrococcus flavescens]
MASGQDAGGKLVPDLVRDLDLPVSPEVGKRVSAAMAELDLTDSGSILFFGARAQQQLTAVADQMLEKVRAKDVGPAGDLLGTMVQRLRDLDVPDATPGKRPGFLQRLFGVKSEIEKFLDRYDDVKGQIDGISDDLERHKTRLLTDIAYLDKLYEANLDYFHTLEVYVAAGRAKLAELDGELLPALEAEVERRQTVLEAQKLRDLRAARDDLERRVHDLLLTRQVTMQSLPSIRLVQENDKSLVGKITSTIANTVPLWKQQLAQAVTIFRSGKAAQAVKAATDLTNELLRSNAENLRQVNRQVREETERGVFDIATVRKANEELIATIEDSLKIAEDGKRKRAEAERELEACEHELRRTLASASSRAGGAAPPAAPQGGSAA